MTADRFKEPKGFQWGHFDNAKGADIRYGHLKPAGAPRGAVVLLPGFRENIEKYFETIQDLNARGLEVWIMDWRGQGGSERYIKEAPQKCHHAGYEEQLDTLHQLTQDIIKHDSKTPLFMMGHSMGGHLGLRYLKEHDGVFDSAMLTSPMLDIQTGALPRPLARSMAKFAQAGDYLEKYVPGGEDWADGASGFDGNPQTSDKARYENARNIVSANEFLRTGDATYGWVYHTFQSIDILNDEDYLKDIQNPILMQVSQNEKIVDRKAQDRAATFLPDCTVLDIPEALHEILSERDELRDQWLAAVDQFIAVRLGQAPAPKKPKQNNTHRPPAP